MSETVWADVLDRCNRLIAARGTPFAGEFIIANFGTLDAFAVEKMDPAVWREFVRRVDSLLPVIKTPTLDKLENTTERVRERLTWADTKPSDRWDGYTVKKFTQEQTKHQGLPAADLQEVSPLCGSAWLVLGE